MRHAIAARSFWIWIALLNLLVGAYPAAAQGGDGYRLDGGRIVIDQPSEWNNWSLPFHALEVTDDGVAPHLFRQRYNVLDDRETFVRPLQELRRRSKEHATLNIDSTETLDVRGNIITKKKKGEIVPVWTYRVRMGISRVGSNAALAANILDGDPNTYWEPDADDPVDNWWVEVDLGRVVPIDSLVVRFVDAELGDPFTQFRVLTSALQVPVLEKTRDIGFQLSARTTVPNRDQRQFDFSLAQHSADPQWTGQLVETIRIVVSDTRGGRSRLISEDQWQALDPADQGDIVYFVQDKSGFEEPVDKAAFDVLPLERQGHKDFYIRERPRLADIEVWGWGDNIGPGAISGNGNAAVSGGSSNPGAAFDGDFKTTFQHSIREKISLVERGILIIDMGATFWLDSMRLTSAGSDQSEGYAVRSSLGDFDTSGQRRWRGLSPKERENNTVERHHNILDTYDPPTKMRFLEIVQFNPIARGGYYVGPNVSEYMLFSEGYAAEVVLTSDLIEIPVGRNLGTINWEAEVPPGTQMEIRTRTGDQTQKVIKYFNATGLELKTLKQWENLLGSLRGPIDTSLVVGTDWSNWSRQYALGDRVTSPARKNLLQIQVKLKTEDRSVAAALNSIGIELLDPAADRLLAELWPIEVKAAGQLDTFEVFARPFFIESPARERSSGFDEVLLSLSAAEMELLELDIGFDENNQPLTSYRASASDFDGLAVLQNQSDSVCVRLPGLIHAIDAGQRLYHRITIEEDEVPTDKDGELLTNATWGLLLPEERGARSFFRKSVDASGQVDLTAIDEATYDELAEEEGQARFFRILVDDGGQFPFAANGDTLGRSAHSALSSSARGRVIGEGPLMRLKFTSPIFVNGTTLEMAVRNTAGGTDMEAAWQSVESGDATPMVASEILSIQVPLDTKPLDNLRITPNPFTPNGDQVNDQANIDFLVVKISASREATVRIFDLSGRRVWEQRQMIGSGPVSIPWNGTDNGGAVVPPGIYICQLELAVDIESAGQTTLSRLIHVAY
jgi:hypothetical protein